MGCKLLLHLLHLLLHLLHRLVVHLLFQLHLWERKLLQLLPVAFEGGGPHAQLPHEAANLIATALRHVVLRPTVEGWGLVRCGSREGSGAGSGGGGGGRVGY